MTDALIKVGTFFVFTIWILKTMNISVYFLQKFWWNVFQLILASVKFDQTYQRSVFSSRLPTKLIGVISMSKWKNQINSCKNWCIYVRPCLSFFSSCPGQNIHLYKHFERIKFRDFLKKIQGQAWINIIWICILRWQHVRLLCLDIVVCRKDLDVLAL